MATSLAASLLVAALAHADNQVIVYGPTASNGSTGWSCSPNNAFTTYTNWGRRYVVVIKNGATHADGASISVDGQEWVGQSEFSGSTDSLLRIIDIAEDGEHSHDLDVCVRGPSGSSVSLRIYHVTEPTFVVYGPHTFNRLNPIADEVEPFVNSYYSTTPHLLRVTNGAPNGANRVTNGSLYLDDILIVGSSDLGTGIATVTRDVSLIGPVVYSWECQCYEADVQDVVKVRNESALGTYLIAQIRATDSTAPTLSVTAPTEGTLTAASSVIVSGSADDSETKVWVTISDSTTGVANAAVHGNGAYSSTFAMLADGRYTIKARAENSAELGATNIFRHVTRDTQAPTLTVNRPGATFAPVDSDSVAISVAWADSITTYITIDGDTVASGSSGTFTKPKYPLDLGPNRIVFRAQDALGHETTIVRFVFRSTVGEAAPIDSVLHPPALAGTEITPFLERVRFLYTGDIQGDTLQKAVVPDSIRPYLAAVVRGRVTARDFDGLPNVKVRVLGHDEFGHALTRADGRFDLVVNGGLQLTLRFTKPGFLEAQRDVQPPVNDFVVQDAVAMIGRSGRRSVVAFDSLRFIRGRFAHDANGDRRIHLLFKAGTVAKIARAIGDTVSFSAIRVRPSEYTVGPDGARTMPGLLPPGSAYTFCMDFSVDEADSVGQATAPTIPVPDVLFTNPVVCLELLSECPHSSRTAKSQQIRMHASVRNP